MLFNNLDLGQFVKTTLAAEIQKSQIGNFVKQKGAPKIIAEILKPKIGDKPKTADGIDMGQQVEAGVIPIIYGHVGMSNTQFDLGQKPSDVDAEFTVQTVKMPISEGPIIGVATRLDDNNISYYPPGDVTANFKAVLLNDSFVMETNGAVNYKDVKLEVTLGDGTTNKQTATIQSTNPLTNEEIEAVNDTTNDKLLNDLGDVTAGKGVNYVLYWNTETGRWEAKSFNALLNETGATYDGGAGGSGGSGGSGGTGGIGGTGGAALGETVTRYTKWNPPPVHVEVDAPNLDDAYIDVTTITAPPSTGEAVVSGKGAPLRTLDQTNPYFITDIDYADVDETVDTIDVTTFFPDGMFQELSTVRTAKLGTTLTLCGTERPITNSGNLNCLTPNVELSEDGRVSTTKTLATGLARINLVFTTTLCGREFVLHQTSYNISALRNGGYKHTRSFSPRSMNAGYTTKEDGTNITGSISGADDCNATNINDFNFQNFTLSDYLDAYPDQILKATNTIRVYAWLGNLDDDGGYTLSTNAYLHAVEVVKPLDEYDGLYKVAKLTSSAYKLFEPDHGFKKYLTDTESDDYSLDDKRRYTQAITGTFGTTSPPEPLVVLDGTALVGALGAGGNDGVDGVDGSAGSAGTSGSVTVPAVPDIPTAEMSRDSSYSGNGVADTVTLPSVTVANADTTASNTLTIRVTSGTIDVTTLGGSVSAIGRNTSAMSLTGTASQLQSTLDSGLVFSSTTATTGDITITFYISSSEGNSETTRTIRSEAVTDYTAPTFTITVTGTSGDFRCETLSNSFIMNTITATGTTDEIAEQIKSAINSYTSTPNWTATRSSNVVTVTGPEILGASYNGVTPSNGATSTPLLATSISTITDGVSPSRTTQPKQNTKNLKSKLLPPLAFTNPLTASDISFAQLAYRPDQEDGNTDIAELGFYIGGRILQEPTEIYTNFSDWQAAGYTSTESIAQNTAWIFFDYLTNTTYGLGNDLKLDDWQKATLYTDIWNASLWCNLQPIPSNTDTFASTLNGILYGAESKFEALQKIANRMYAKFLYLNGNPRLIYEGSAYSWGSYTPRIKKLVNQTNSANLSYQGGSIDNVFNVINVKYNEPEINFRLKEVQYKNTASIAKFGERQTTIELWGCTDKQEALWHGAWAYETEATNAEVVTYIAGWDHFDVLPNDLIYLNDTLRPDTQSDGGRVTAVNGTTLTLDRSASGAIAVMGDDGVIYYGTASGTTATMSSGSFVKHAVWNEYSGTLVANYRVVAVEESEDGIYAVTAHKHDPDKYNRIWANTV